MSGVNLEVRLDTKQFEDRLNFASKETVNALRRSVDRAARTARKQTIPVMAADIGVSKSEFARAVPTVRGSTQGNISATWTISKARISALKVGKFAPILSALRGSYSGSTFRLSGGGSASLNIGKSFIMNAGNGASLLMIRTGIGRSAIKAVYAESPHTSMQYENKPETVWKQTAERELTKEVNANLGAVFAGGSVSPAPGND